ncbi:hypothetical protein [Litoribacter populi]|uniref:hypothetical protein n=1 Tax=Litoribacter populi TaxID=2598460 RepID=UPI00117EEADC|nr:hypothetical protein [Litoribacter populi]
MSSWYLIRTTVLLFFIFLIFCSHDEGVTYQSVKIDELKFHRNYSLKEMLMEVVDSEYHDEQSIDLLVENFLISDSLLVERVNNSGLGDKVAKGFNKGEIVLMIDKLNDKMSFSFINFIKQLIFDLVVNFLLFMGIVFVVTIPFDYRNLFALRLVINNSILIIFLGFIISFWFSPAEIVGIVPATKEKEISKVVRLVEKNTLIYD